LVIDHTNGKLADLFPTPLRSARAVPPHREQKRMAGLTLALLAPPSRNHAKELRGLVAVPASTQPLMHPVHRDNERIARDHAHPADSINPFPSGKYLSQLLRSGTRRVLDAARRRRWLLLTPIALMVPLSIAFALLFPRTFETSALLLLQETARNNPLVSEPVAPEALQQKVPGLEALLKSDQVLTRAIQEMRARGSRLASGDEQAAVRNLRAALSVELIGTDFLSVRLRGSAPRELDHDLSHIIGNFLEALLSEPAASASQMVLARQQQYISGLEARRRQVQEQLNALRTDGSTRSSNSQLEALQRQSSSLEQQATAAREVYEALSRRYPASSPGLSSGILSAPGRIKIVDQPKEPVPTSSRLKLILAGCAAGILLGVMLAWAAELFDSTIYDTDDLVAAAGLPLLAILRQSPPVPVDITPVSRTKGAMRRWIVFAICAAAALLALSAVLRPEHGDWPWSRGIDSATSQPTPEAGPQNRPSSAP
jgi:hypothetical protein